MNSMYWAIIGLGAFVAVWFLFVVPAERRHHERKLELLQRKIEQRKSQNNKDQDDRSSNTDEPKEP